MLLMCPQRRAFHSNFEGRLSVDSWIFSIIYLIGLSDFSAGAVSPDYFAVMAEQKVIIYHCSFDSIRLDVRRPCPGVLLPWEVLYVHCH